MVPDIGLPELIIVLVIIMIVFGVGKLPEIGSSVGRGIREFRKAQNDDDPKSSNNSGSEEKQEVHQNS